MAKPFYVEKEGPLSTVLTVIGAILFSISLATALGVDPLGLGSWSFWVGLVGAIILIIGVIWLISHVMKIRDFERLFNVQGKKALMQNLDELEYTAWRLPEKYEKMVAEKKKEYKM